MNPTRDQLIEKLVAWRMSTVGLAGGRGAEAWTLHYRLQETRQLQFLVNFYRISMESDERLANARVLDVTIKADPFVEDPVEGDLRPLRHEFAVELMPKVYYFVGTYLEAVDYWRGLKHEVYPQARVVERLVSDWREIKHVERPGLKLVDPNEQVSPELAEKLMAAVEDTVDEIPPYQISGDRFRELSDQEYADMTGMPLSTDEAPEGFGQNEAGQPVWRGPEVIVPDQNPDSWTCEEHSRWFGDYAWDADKHIEVMHTEGNWYLAPDRVVRRKS